MKGGVAHVPIAIIELLNGKVINISPSGVLFKDKVEKEV